MTYLIAEKTWINKQFTFELEHIQTENIMTFFSQLLHQTHVKILTHENFYKKDALKITELIKSTLKSDILSKSQWHVRQNIMISSDNNFIYEQILKNSININHCINYYLFVDNLINVKLWAKLLFIRQMIYESVFYQLHTKKQLDYAVWNESHFSFIIISYWVMIQNE